MGDVNAVKKGELASGSDDGSPARQQKGGSVDCSGKRTTGARGGCLLGYGVIGPLGGQMERSILQRGGLSGREEHHDTLTW
jgi:hypothetical protein